MNTLIKPTLAHQIKSIATFVVAIIEKETGNQVEPARPSGNQETTVK
jgi:hypothetical protein